MKILHVSTSSQGGAGGGAYLLHQAMLRRNIDSKFLTLVGQPPASDDVYVLANSRSKRIARFLATKIDKAPLLLYPNRSRRIFSTGLLGWDISKHPLYQWADLINLHWVNHGYISLRSLGHMDKPIVWTLRDMWLLTGGCHHALSCQNYSTGCGACPHLKSTNEADLSSRLSEQKRRYLRQSNVVLAPISSWLAQCAAASSVVQGMPCEVVSNGIVWRDYSRFDKDAARASLDAKPQKTIILVGATDPTETYKGFKYFLEALNYLPLENFQFWFFGKVRHSDLAGLKLDYRLFGYIKELDVLAKLYSAADIFVAPSIAEAFGKTLVEAMAARTPVVCFDVGGPKDIVQHKRCGYRAKLFSARDLAQGITWVINNNQRNMLGHNACHIALTKFDLDGQIVGRYMELYGRCLQQPSR